MGSVRPGLWLAGLRVGRDVLDLQRELAEGKPWEFEKGIKGLGGGVGMVQWGTGTVRLKWRAFMGLHWDGLARIDAVEG